MKKAKKIGVISLLVISFLASLIYMMPAWLVGSLLEHYSNKRVTTVNETGSFWHGNAMLVGLNAGQKLMVPVVVIGWDISLGVKKFITIKFNVSKQVVAEVALQREGVTVNNVNLALSLDQMSVFLGNLNTLGLSGNAKVTAKAIEIGKKIQGTVNLQLDDVGSSLAPVNPIGSYTVNVDLGQSSLSVSSDSDSVVEVSGDGSFASLTLQSKIKPEKKDEFLQFMTMMGVPQADGSYQLKVY